MNDTTHTTIFGTTTIPCPPWCTLPGGHGYDLEIGAKLSRIHVAELGEVDVDGRQVLVHLEATETSQITVEGASIALSEVTVGLESDGADLTGPQAREVAALLLRAADTLDRVVSAEGRS